MKMPPLKIGGHMTKRLSKKSLAFIKNSGLSLRNETRERPNRYRSSRVSSSKASIHPTSAQEGAPVPIVWPLWWSIWTSSHQIHLQFRPQDQYRAKTQMLVFWEGRQNQVAFLAGERKVLKSTRKRVKKITLTTILKMKKSTWVKSLAWVSFSTSSSKFQMTTSTRWLTTHKHRMTTCTISRCRSSHSL